MTNFDDDIRSALHADAADAPEPPLAWTSHHDHHLADGHSVIRSAAASRTHRRGVLPGAAGLAVAGLTVAGLFIARGDGGRGTAPGNTMGVGGSATAATASTSPLAGTDVENLLITGADSGACIDTDPPGTGPADPARVGERFDTIVILRIDPAAHRAAILWFPRDLWVAVPGRGDQRITSTYLREDSTLLAQTIYDNFGVTVDHHIQIDFCAFTHIIDAIDGIAIPFIAPVQDRHVGLEIPAAGCHTFDGDEALAYMRSRHLQQLDADGTWQEDPTGDFGRIARQQDVLRRVLATALERGLLEPDVARALIEALQTYVVRDRNLTIDDLLSLADALRHLDREGSVQYQVDSTAVAIGGNIVLRPLIDTPEMRSILATFRGEAALIGAAPSGRPSGALDGAILPDPTIMC